MNIDTSKYLEELKSAKKGSPNSEKAFWIQEIADFLDSEWIVIFGKVKDLKPEWIRDIYQEGRKVSGWKKVDAKFYRKTSDEIKESMQKKMWWLIKQSK